MWCESHRELLLGLGARTEQDEVQDGPSRLAMSVNALHTMLEDCCWLESMDFLSRHGAGLCPCAAAIRK